MKNQFDVIIVGGGHAGAEAAWAAANVGARVALVTLDPSKIGVMPCNPSIGGLAKGQMVREIDALGGLMGLAADATGILFKTLNASRGPAVHGPRCQCDKHAYSQAVYTLLQLRNEIEIISGSVEQILVKDSRVQGVIVKLVPSPGIEIPGLLNLDRYESFELLAPSVVLTTGTFMRGLMHRGADQISGGRDGESASVGISGALRDLGFELGRLKTGTPPRLKKSTIDWDALEPQSGDSSPTAFSDLTDAGLNPVASAFPALDQTECRVTSTNAAIHDLIRDNLHLAPIYNGQIASTGPRYCPSIEDKVVRFADRSAHHVFLEPESHRDESIYCNGISTSLPIEVQQQMVRLMPGCKHSEILRPGYAVEYDMVRPHQIDATCMTKKIAGFFLAGQINGTSGYEEAAGQGLLAGLNAARFAQRIEPVTLGRDQAYLGVMMDDLVTKTPVEPYRMFTSRAEHRLLLRADNAADRLTPVGRMWGLVNDERWSVFQDRQRELAAVNRAVDRANVDGEPVSKTLKRPGFTVDDLMRTLDCDRDGQSQSPERKRGVAMIDQDRKRSREPLTPALSGGERGSEIVNSTSASAQRWRRESLFTVLADRQYAGYLKRQSAEVKRQAQMEHRKIPLRLDFALVAGLRAEAQSALSRFRPTTFGQASRLEGVTPADLSLVMIAMKRLGGEDQPSESESLTPRLA